VHHEDGVPNTQVRIPPEWTDSLEEAQYILSKIQTRLKELTALQSKHLTKPTFDDSLDEEKQIDELTQEITKMFSSCHNCIKRIQRSSFSSRGQTEVNVAKNVVTSLVTTLQNLSNTFRSDQNSYLNKIKSREERSQQYFGETSSDWNFDDWGNNGNKSAEENSQRPRVGNQQQLLMLEENSAFVEQREKEIQNVVRSIYELNTIFKEMSHMVADQGTVLDRIDYNIEQTQVRVHEGLIHLQKAEGHQKKNRKMMCIVTLASTIIVLIIILIVVKS